jgi:hypothetical protein
VKTRNIAGFRIMMFDCGQAVAIGRGSKAVMAPVGPTGVRRTVIELVPVLRKCIEAKPSSFLPNEARVRVDGMTRLHGELRHARQ